MCFNLEFTKRAGTEPEAKNRMTCCRLALNIIGFSLVLAIGVAAALLATYHAEWLPSFSGNDAIYWRISKHKTFTASTGGRVFNLTRDAKDKCDNHANLRLGTVVFQCGDAAMGRCIPMDNVCDNKQHCPDYSDESSDVCDPFCELASKRGLRFYCDVKVGLNNTIVSKCMSTNVKCDGKVQCTGTAEDADDESQCSEGTFINKGKGICSKENNWLCGDNSQCIRSSDVCNGVNNCDDGSDERESQC